MALDTRTIIPPAPHDPGLYAPRTRVAPPPPALGSPERLTAPPSAPRRPAWVSPSAFPEAVRWLAGWQ